MEQLRGFKSKRHPNHICKVKKVLYGLKQAPRAWYDKITEFLVQSRFSVALAECSLFKKFEEGKLAMALVYVDDLIITGDDEDEI